MTGKELGKISAVSYGLNDRGQLGMSLTFTGKGWGVGAWIGHVAFVFEVRTIF